MNSNQTYRNNRNRLIPSIIVFVAICAFLFEILVLVLVPFRDFFDSTPAFFDRLTIYLQFASTVVFCVIAWLVYDLEGYRNRVEERYDERDNRIARISLSEQVDEYVSKVDDIVLSFLQ